MLRCSRDKRLPIGACAPRLEPGLADWTKLRCSKKRVPMPLRRGSVRALPLFMRCRFLRDPRLCWTVISEIELYSQDSGAWTRWYQQLTPCWRMQLLINHGRLTSAIHRQISDSSAKKALIQKIHKSNNPLI